MKFAMVSDEILSMGWDEVSKSMGWDEIFKIWDGKGFDDVFQV